MTGGQFHLDPATYMAEVRAEVAAYDDLQDAVATAAAVRPAATVLDLGTGTGETARRVLARHPGAHLVAVDASPEMVAVAAASLPGADVREGRLEGDLPAGPFDLVVSALAVHHLDGRGKAALFRRLAERLSPGGRLVLGDVVVPDDPADAVVPLEAGVDLPDRVEDLIAWLGAAGFAARVAWSHRDLVVIAADRPGLPDPAWAAAPPAAPG